MANSTIHLALGILALLGFVFRLRQIPGTQESRRNKISYALFQLSLLLGGLGYVLAIPLLKNAFLLLILVSVIYESITERRAPQTPDA